MSNDTKPTLTYWNGRGLCEQVRFMLAACGIEYEERVPGLDGLCHLSEKVHMDHLRDNDYLLFKQVPLLCIDGLKLVQSRAIVRYLAGKHGLAGATSAQTAMCDVVAEGIQDWFNAMGRAFEFCGAYEPNEQQLGQISVANQKYLPIFERLAAVSETGFLMGSHGVAGMSYPDVLLLEILEMIVSRNAGALADYPCLTALHAKLREVPRLKEFLASDRRKSKDPAGIPGYIQSVIATLS